MENKIQKLYRNKKPKEWLKVDDIKGTRPKKFIKELKVSTEIKDYKDNIISRKPIKNHNHDYLINKENNCYDYYNNVEKYINNNINNINKRHQGKVLIENKNTRENLFPETNKMLLSGDYKKQLLNIRPKNLIIDNFKTSIDELNYKKIEEPNFNNINDKKIYFKNRNLFYGLNNEDYKNITDSSKKEIKFLNNKEVNNNDNNKINYKKEKDLFWKNYDTLTEQLLKYDKKENKRRDNLIIS